MKTLYLDCQMGAAGDMLTAALLELFEDKDKVIDELNHLGIPHVKYEMSQSVKCGITGTHVEVKVDGLSEGEMMEHHHEGHHHHHSHNNMHGIDHILNDHMHLDEALQKDIKNVYQLIAKAESRAHQQPIDQIHFHEVGNMDAIADVSAVCYLMNKLHPDYIVSSPIRVGYGQVHCAHGILPVPAPATAYILEGVPIYAGDIEGEMCTPTGAALLKYFVNKFEAMPMMKITAIGYGMGYKDFGTANCVRAMIGEENDKKDTVVMLSCNIDDMTGEDIGYAMNVLFEEGAREVYTQAIGMKKSRPGILLNVLTDEAHLEKMIALIFKYTTTIGIRQQRFDRYVLKRETGEKETAYGKVHYKKSSGYGTERFKYEYDDLAKIAKEKHLSLEEIRETLKSDI